MLFGAAAGVVAGTAAACSDSSGGSTAVAFYGVACTDDSGCYADAGGDAGPVAFYGVAFTDSGADANDGAIGDASDDGPDGDQ